MKKNTFWKQLRWEVIIPKSQWDTERGGTTLKMALKLNCVDGLITFPVLRRAWQLIVDRAKRGRNMSVYSHSQDLPGQSATPDAKQSKTKWNTVCVYFHQFESADSFSPPICWTCVIERQGLSTATVNTLNRFLDSSEYGFAHAVLYFEPFLECVLVVAALVNGGILLRTKVDPVSLFKLLLVLAYLNFERVQEIWLFIINDQNPWSKTWYFAVLLFLMYV